MYFTKNLFNFTVKGHFIYSEFVFTINFTGENYVTQMIHMQFLLFITVGVRFIPYVIIMAML